MYHVNLKPVVFYYLSEELIFNGFASSDDFHAFIFYVYGTIRSWDKPMLARAKVYRWQVGEFGKEHTSSFRTVCFEVQYQGYFYTENGGRYEDRQYCVEAIIRRSIQQCFFPSFP